MWKSKIRQQVVMVDYAYNPSTQKAEAERLWVKGQPELLTETCTKPKTKRQEFGTGNKAQW